MNIPLSSLANSFNVSNINYEHYAEEDDNEEEQVPRVEVSFFAKGREYESTNVNHKFTEAEKQVMAQFDSLDFLPPHSKVYRAWLRCQPLSWDWDRWVVMGLIGICVGLIGFLLHQVIDVIAETKWNYADELIGENFFIGWLWIFGFSLLFLLPSTLIVVYLRPSASGSGLPELIGFLNGTLIRHIFNIKTLAVKFFSCAMAVGSGMPVGPEGPMIHMGALIGAGLSQFESKTFGFRLPIFQRFRNSQDRRNFISAGAAAGIASAFGAPVGGLLFAMEEVSSYWSLSLAWQIFFCCMISSFTTDLLSSSFSGFKYTGFFGQFKTDRYILFNVASGIDMNILALVPGFFLGIVGGLLGSAFTFLNLKLVRLRKKILTDVKSTHIANVLKICEPVLILFLMSTATVLIPDMLPCTPYACTVSMEKLNSHSHCTSNATNGLTIETSVSHFNCDHDKSNLGNGSTFVNGSFSQSASLLFGTGESAIHHLFSRNTHLQFDYAPMAIFLIFYFIMACWAAGTYISSGLVVPMLLIGGLYGRMIGRLMVDVLGVKPGDFWNFVDPGAMALIGACSFFGGVTRLTMSLTVIMVEMTNDIQFLLLIMTTVMTAKWVGDYFTHPFYHALLELKCIPFLDSEPVVLRPSGEKLNLELFRAENVMNHPVVTMTMTETVSRLAEILTSTNHGGFPVVDQDKRTFQGLITRSELTLFLLDFNANSKVENPSNVYVPRLSFPQISAHINRKVRDPPGVKEIIQKLSERRDGLQINLSDYINTSSVSIPLSFSLQRTYIIFRSLGLRHMTVVDENNCVQGIITRKDLLGFALEDKLLTVPIDVAKDEVIP